MSKVMATSLDMSGNAITNLPNGVASTDAATVGQISGGYQPVDATLTAIAATTPLANEMIYFTATDVASVTTTTTLGRNLLASSTAAVARGNIDSPPTSHADSGNTYGLASTTLNGHAKASSATPVMDGTGSAGTDATKFAQEGHCHPSDTSRLALAGGTMTGDLLLEQKKLRSQNTGGGATTYVDVYSEGINFHSSGATTSASIYAYPNVGATDTLLSIGAGTTTNLEFGVSDTLATKKLRLAAGVSISNSGETASGNFSGTNAGWTVTTASGFTSMGAANASFSHFYTDLPEFYFSKGIQVVSDVRIYSRTVSVTVNMSGITNNSTFELGCDHRTTVRGSLSRTTTFATGSGNPILTLSTTAGRPPYTVVLMVPSDNGIYQCYLTAAGALYINQIYTGSASQTIYLDSITFPRA